MDTTRTLVYRLQPADLGIDHRSETSNGELDRGPHVFGSLAEARVGACGWCRQRGTWELLTIEVAESDVRDNHDYEGFVLVGGRGRIVSRHRLGRWSSVMHWAKSGE